MNRLKGLLLLSAILVVTASCEQPVVEIDLPPSASISVLQEGDYVTGMTLITGTASDDKGIAKVELSFDNGANYVTAVGTNSWEYNLDTLLMSTDAVPVRVYPDGALPIRLRAKDTSGYYA